MSVYYDFDEVDAFTVGAIGQPGSRVFFLQARRGTVRVTVKCEKQQASAIAEVVDVDEEGEAIEDDDDDRGHLRVFLTRAQAAAFCERTDSVVSAGRPGCRWCTQPMNPEGHVCPRMN